MAKIESVEARLFNIPLAEPLADAKHGIHTHFELVTATVHTSDGLSGTGYTYTGGRGGHSVLALLQNDLAPMLIGMDAEDVEALHDAMYWHVHYVGRGGVAGFAISPPDIALWDLRGKRLNQPLCQMAGGHGNSTRAYAGGIDLNFPLDKLLANIDGYLSASFNAVKIKVGQPDLADDLTRAAAVRKLLGPDRNFMVDANYGLTVDQAIAAANGFKKNDILWFEEPIDPEDMAGYAAIAKATGAPLAQGENLHSQDEFRRAITHANLAFIQPDASNCGGITGWLRVAEMAKVANIPICSHGMQELHVGLMAAQPHAGWMEVHSFPIDAYTTRPLVLQDSLAIASDAPGTGVEFDWSKLQPFEVS
ncbi:MAG: mandelate racemase/muconate lactonizing enzyme family protein [Alphaproteobacteria bacterium]